MKFKFLTLDNWRRELSDFDIGVPQLITQTEGEGIQSCLGSRIGWQCGGWNDGEMTSGTALVRSAFSFRQWFFTR